MKQISIETGGRRYSLPEVFWFGLGKPTLCFWEFLRYGPPRAGDWYVSGAIPEVYQAQHDLRSAYLIVQPTHRAIPNAGYRRGALLFSKQQTS